MEYSNRKTASLKWHWFQKYFCIPLSAGISFYLALVPYKMPQMPMNAEKVLGVLYAWHLLGTSSYAVLQTRLMIYLILMALLMLAALIGTYLWKLFGIICWIIFLGIGTLTSFYLLGIAVSVYSSNASTVPFIANSIWKAMGHPYIFLAQPSYFWLILLCFIVILQVAFVTMNTMYYKERRLLFLTQEEQEEERSDEESISRNDLHDMKYCPFCGSTLRDSEIRYCENCGRKVR